MGARGRQVVGMQCRGTVKKRVDAKVDVVEAVMSRCP